MKMKAQTIEKKYRTKESENRILLSIPEVK